MLEIKNYSFEYFEGKKVVKNINLYVKEGDIYAFVGRNGAGKTTTLKSIVGINHITEGDILLDQVSIKEKEIEFKKNIKPIPTMIAATNITIIPFNLSICSTSVLL